MKKLIAVPFCALTLFSVLSSGCSMIEETKGKLMPDKTIAVVYPGVDTSTGKVIIFPLFLSSNGDFAAANAEFDNSVLNALLIKSWSSELEGSDKITIPKTAIDSLPHGWEVAELMVKAIDNTREEKMNSEMLQDFSKAVANKFGPGIIAVGIVFEDEEMYKKTATLHYNAGLFDLKSSKFKWITNTVQKTPAPVGYQVILQKALDDSWSKLKEKNEGLVR